VWELGLAKLAGGGGRAGEGGRRTPAVQTSDHAKGQGSWLVLGSGPVVDNVLVHVTLKGAHDD